MTDESKSSGQNKPSPEYWVRDYGDYLYRYALSRLKDPDQASDCLQETFLAGIKGLERFDGRRDIKYWLRGIMHNKIMDVFRAQKKVPNVDLGEDEAILDSALFKYSGIANLFPEEWKFDPRSMFDREEFWRVFQICIDELKGPVRQAFVLRMIEGHDTENVCKVMDIEPNHLWVLLHRARKQLKGLLEKHWDNSDDKVKI